ACSRKRPLPHRGMNLSGARKSRKRAGTPMHATPAPARAGGMGRGVHSSPGLSKTPPSRLAPFRRKPASPTRGEATRARGSAELTLSRAKPAALLAWYDRHRRKLPWRAGAGERADPYRVWLSEIMLQQTRVNAVLPYYAKFLAWWPNVRALAAAPLDEVLKTWAGLGYYARAHNLHACAGAIVERHDGAFPREESALRT